MKRPYVKKIDEIAGFKVWIVNGYWIRKNICDDFTNYAQHYQFEFIPEDEFWIDIEATKRKEVKFYIQAMLVMNKLMAEGISRKKAARIADELEKVERSKTKAVKKLEEEKQDEEKTIKKIHKTFLKRLSGNVKVWIVRGDLVRALFYADFTQGGHEYVYKFIPKGEVWLDDDIFKKEIPFVLIHELHERRWMARGLRYDPAHEYANAVEYDCRNNPNKIKRRLRLEIRMNHVR